MCLKYVEDIVTSHILNIMRTGQLYDILSALIMKHMAGVGRGFGGGKKHGKCNISQREGWGNMTCKMQESVRHH